jgi:hypothetical protein
VVLSLGGCCAIDRRESVCGNSSRTLRGKIAVGLKLHFGVLEQPYRASGARVGAVTTGDVATWLENRYGVMSAYARVHRDNIAGAMESSLTGALESLLSGHRVDPFGRAMQQIETGFKRFITSREAERVGIPGTPTKAALAGVNHRLKHPYRKSNPRRPSFRDTGLYLASFRAWVEQ